MSRPNKSHGLRQSYEMRNISPQNRAHLRHQRNNQHIHTQNVSGDENINDNRRHDNDDEGLSQPSSSRQNFVCSDQITSRNQSYYNNRPIFNLQNPNYMNPSKDDDYDVETTSPHKPTSPNSPRFHIQRPDFTKEQHPGYGKTRPKYTNQLSMQTTSEAEDKYEQCDFYGRGRPDLNRQILNYSHSAKSSPQNEEEYPEIFSQWHVAAESELVNRQHRTTSIHRNAAIKEVPETNSRTFPRTLENRRKWMSSPGYTIKRTSLEQCANTIANHMEQDDALMEDTPESELLRREALRDMPQCLTIKRIIKKKLNTSVNKHAKHRALDLYTRMKYGLGMKTSKVQNSLKSLAYSAELWYSSLKTIEGHFGSGVASYFKFFRWLFIMNCLIAFFTVMFLVVPQLLYPYSRHDAESGPTLVIYENSTGGNNSVSALMPEALAWSSLKLRRVLPGTNAKFEFQNIFTGKGYFTNTTLYYGFYTNDVISVAYGYNYNMPYAYFFTMFCLYVTSFIVLSTSMARSYRRSFIETQGGLKNVYAHKVFCGWDYSIATQEAADLKSCSIYHELKELLSDSIKELEDPSCMQRFWTFVVQLICNLAILLKLVATGYIMWILLDRTNSHNGQDNSPVDIGVVTAAIINGIMLLFPSIFSFIVQYEDYKHPRAALYITLIRTFLLKTVVVGVFLAFWLTHSKNEKCWETSIGQHIYRLVLFDFLFSVIIAALVEAMRYVIYKKIWKKIGVPEFDIARHTLQLMYNQTLFWVGFYYSPLLSVMVIVKLWCTWYIRRTCLLYFCQPSTKSWRGAQTHTWFLILSFLSLLLVLITHGYIMVDVATSKCGPFRDYVYMYEMILKGIFQLEQNNLFWEILMYFTKPGTVALILIAMCVLVYYLRAKAIAQKGMVDLLRDMLILEAKDKEFLLKNISKVTEGQWQYNLQDRTNQVWDSFEDPGDNVGAIKKVKPKNNSGDKDETTSSGSEAFQDFSPYDSSYNRPLFA